jgi:PLP dependent protein
MKDTMRSNLVDVRGRIAEACAEHDREVDSITLVAVTKTFPASTIRQVVSTGLQDIGESKVQEAEAKIAELGAIARWHLIGHLQSNKVKKAVQLFDVIQSVDSLKLAEEINKQASAISKTIDCLIEVNCSGEKQKYGVAPDECLKLLQNIVKFPNIQLRGLMTIGPMTDDESKVRKSFQKCAKLFEEAKAIGGEGLDTLSMGMSHDFHLAIAEGATMVRLGSALFGKRGAKVQDEEDKPES